MSAGEIVLLVVIALIVALAVGGMIAQRRRLARNRPVFESSLEEVNHDLAVARAKDRGWEAQTLDAAARDAYARERGGAPAELTLVRIVDRPGTDADKAIFRAESGGRREELTLGRQDGAWVLESLG